MRGQSLRLSLEGMQQTPQLCRKMRELTKEDCAYTEINSIEKFPTWSAWQKSKRPKPDFVHRRADRGAPVASAPRRVGQRQSQALLKPENLQPIGSFKLRGAYNKIASLSDEERRRGVISYSSGNHAQGVAYAARALGVKALIVMPDNAPTIKRKATAALAQKLSR